MTERAEAIRAEGLEKRFAHRRAVNRVDLVVRHGESVALFGPNGAGKTTLLRLLSTALKPDAGRLRIDGRDARREAGGVRGSIGLVSHQSFLYDDLTARQNLEFFGSLYGVPDAARRATELLELVELSSRADDAVGTLSRGMQQRVSLARALVHDPRILFLDEPFSGLDPHAAGVLRQTLAGLRTEGRTVVLATHNLREGLELAGRWAILARGRIVDEGATSDVEPRGFEARYFERVAGAGARR